MQRRSIRKSRYDTCFDEDKDNSKSPSYWRNHNRKTVPVKVKQEKDETEEKWMNKVPSYWKPNTNRKMSIFPASANRKTPETPYKYTNYSDAGYNPYAKHSNDGKNNYDEFKNDLTDDNDAALPPLEPASPSPTNATNSGSIYSDPASNNNNNDIPPPILPSNASSRPYSPNILAIARIRHRFLFAQDPPPLQSPNVIHYGPQFTNCNLNYYGVKRDCYKYQESDI